MRKSKAESDETHCDITGCKLEVKRSLSFKKVQSALPNMKFGNVGKKVHLCKDHYKEYKRATKDKRKIETLTWD